MVFRLFLIAIMLIWAGGAQAGITLGVVASPSDPASPAAQARQLARHLEQELGEPVDLRHFQAEATLHQWLSRYRQMDLALLPPSYVGRQPAGEFFLLAELLSGDPRKPASPSLLVARQGLSPRFLERVRETLQSLPPYPKGRPEPREPASKLPRLLLPLEGAESAPATTGDSALAAESFTGLEAGTSGPAIDVPATAAEIQRSGPVAAGTNGSSPSSGAGLESLSDFSPVTLEADSLEFDQENSLYQASGRARLEKGGVTLRSDRVEWNDLTGEATAEGNVLLTEPAGEMAGEQLRINLEEQRGRLTKGRVFLREHNFHLTGDEIEKLGEQTYRVTDGTFTTCDGEVPSWKFGARRVDVTLGDNAKARHVVFYLKDVPVLYVPYISYPLKTERESGFLMPRYGYSQTRGTQLSLAYYQVIDRHMDATAYLDYFSSLGVGSGLEYRYILGEDNEGSAQAYYVSGFNDAGDRFAFEWNHLGALPGKVRMAADVEYVSTRDYFEDFGEVAEEFNKDQAQSILYFSRNWSKFNLAGQMKFIRDLEQSNEQTLQRLPEIRFDAIQQRILDSAFFYSLESSYNYFWREEGLKGQRVSVRPALSAVFQPGRVLEIEPELGYRERLYWTSDEGPGFDRQGIFDFSTRVSSQFARVFSLNSGAIGKIRHRIEPEVVYRYTPSKNQEQLPQFDAGDNIGPENTLAYSLINRFAARLEPEGGASVTHEFLYLRLSQEYDIRESRRDRLNPQEKRRPFSDLRTEMILRPTRWSYLDVDVRYDVFGNDGLSRFDALGGVTDGAGNGVSAEYRFTRDLLEYVGATLDTALFKPVYLNYQHRYDFRNDQELEKVLNLEYRAQCWSVYLTLRERLEDQEFLLSFSLSGLGRVARFGGSLGSAE